MTPWEMTMKHLLVLAACLVLAAGCSCKPSGTDSTEGQTAAQSAEQPQAGGQPAGGPTEQGPPRQVEITEPLVLKYMEYQKEVFALAVKYAAESKKNLESSKGDLSKTAQQVNLAERYGKEMDDKLKAKRKELGLSEEEFDTLQEAVVAMATSRGLYNQMGGDAQLAQMEAEAKKQIEALPADQRAAAEAQAAETTKALKSLKDGVDIRQKYGNTAADALLKHADALAKAYWDALKATGERQ